MAKRTNGNITTTGAAHTASAKASKKSFQTESIYESEGWKEVKKDLEKGANGEFVVTKISLEKKGDTYFGLKKDTFDFVLRGIGILAIFVPFLLFYLQQDSEADKQRATSRSDLYANITSRLHTILDRQETDSSMARQILLLQSEYYPRFKLLATTEEVHVMGTLVNNLAYYHLYNELSDTLFALAYNISRTRGKMYEVVYKKHPYQELAHYALQVLNAKPYLDYTRRHIFGQLEAAPSDSAGFAMVKRFGGEELLIIDSMKNFQLKISDVVAKYSGEEKYGRQAMGTAYGFDYAYLGQEESGHQPVEGQQGALLRRYRMELLNLTNKLDLMMVASFKAIYGHE